LVVLDEQGRPSFEGLQRHTTQVAFYAFDLLQLAGQDTIALPYEQRRSLLADVLPTGANWAVPAHRVGDGAALLAATAAQGLEGVMAKRLGSVYRPGRRSPDWRKVKNRVRTEVVVGGFTAGTGNRSSTFGALLVGRERPDGSLAFAGGVGTGFTQRLLDDLTAQLRGRATATCPFDPPPPRTVAVGATWVRPELRAHIEITEFTNDGLVRHASFVGLT
jgi:bifunctional non-homologous end joining protein LigD